MMEFWKIADCEIARASYMLSLALFVQNSGDPEVQERRENAERVKRGIQGEVYLEEAHGEVVYDIMVESLVR